MGIRVREVYRVCSDEEFRKTLSEVSPHLENLDKKEPPKARALPPKEKKFICNQGVARIKEKPEVAELQWMEDLRECVGVTLFHEEGMVGVMHADLTNLKKGKLVHLLKLFPEKIRPNTRVVLATSLYTENVVSVCDTLGKFGFSNVSIFVNRMLEQDKNGGEKNFVIRTITAPYSTFDTNEEEVKNMSPKAFFEKRAQLMLEKKIKIPQTLGINTKTGEIYQ